MPQIRPLLMAQENKILSPQLPLQAARRTAATSTSCAGTARRSAGSASGSTTSRACMPVREKYSRNVGLWQTEAGQLNEAVHLWVYTDLNERAAVRAKALAGSGVAGLPRQGAAAARHHAVDRADPDAGLADEVADEPADRHPGRRSEPGEARSERSRRRDRLRGQRAPHDEHGAAAPVRSRRVPRHPHAGGRDGGGGRRRHRLPASLPREARPRR